MGRLRHGIVALLLGRSGEVPALRLATMHQLFQRRRIGSARCRRHHKTDARSLKLTNDLGRKTHAVGLKCGETFMYPNLARAMFVAVRSFGHFSHLNISKPLVERLQNTVAVSRQFPNFWPRITFQRTELVEHARNVVGHQARLIRCNDYRIATGLQSLNDASLCVFMLKREVPYVGLFYFVAVRNHDFLHH